MLPVPVVVFRRHKVLQALPQRHCTLGRNNARLLQGIAVACLIEARRLGRIDTTGQTTLLAPTDFALQAGERVVIVGASGSGKSLFLRTLALLDPPDSGEVLWMGIPVTAPRIPAYRADVCYLAQRPTMVDSTVRDNLALPFSLKSLRPRQFDPQVAISLLEQAGK
ncbi:MAG TPA: hypothetical protein DIT18_10520, partial [Pseudomonas sp.]|nr:hypothetical protein [Pseudomonas sp.]